MCKMNFDGCFLLCTFAYVNVGHLQVSGKGSHQMKWKSDLELWSWAGAESEDILKDSIHLGYLMMWAGNGFLTFRSNVGICHSCWTTLTLVWGHCTVWKCQEPITQWCSTTSQKTKTYATQLQKPTRHSYKNLRDTATKTYVTRLQKLSNCSLSILYDYFSIHVWRLRGTATGLKLNVSQINIRCVICFLCLRFRASLIYINNCPKCNTKQSIYYSASSLYMFWVPTTPIIWSPSIGHIFCLATSLQRGQSSLFIILRVHSTWPCWREVTVKRIWPVPEAVVRVLCTSRWWVWLTPKTCRVNLQNNK